MIRIRVIEEQNGVHIRSKSFYPGSTASYKTLCELMKNLGFEPSSRFTLINPSWFKRILRKAR